MFSYEICELYKNTFFYRTFPVATSENNKQQQLSECFANIWLQDSPFLLQELISEFAVWKHCSGTLLAATLLTLGAAHFNRLT